MYKQVFKHELKNFTLKDILNLFEFSKNFVTTAMFICSQLYTNIAILNK